MKRSTETQQGNLKIQIKKPSQNKQTAEEGQVLNSTKRENCLSEPQKAKIKPTNNPFATTHLSKPIIEGKRACSFGSKQARSKPLRPTRNLNQENLVISDNPDHPSIKKAPSKTHIATISNPLSNRKLNLLTSPKSEANRCAYANTISSSNHQGTRANFVAQNKLAAAEKSFEIALMEASLKSPPANCRTAISNNGGPSGKIKLSDLLHPSPSAEFSQSKENFQGGEKEHYQGSEPEFLINLGVNPYTGLFQQDEQQIRHTRFPSANPDKRNIEDTMRAHKSPERYIQPAQVDITSSEIQPHQDILKLKEVDDQGSAQTLESENEQELVSRLLSSGQQTEAMHKYLSPTQKFENPVPHSHRLSSEADDIFYEHRQRHSQIMIAMSNGTEDGSAHRSKYGSRTSSALRSTTNREEVGSQQQQLTFNRNSQLISSFGFNGLNIEELSDEQAENNIFIEREIREQKMSDQNRAPVFGEDLDPSSINNIITGSEVDLIVTEEPSSIEKSTPATFRKLKDLHSKDITLNAVGERLQHSRTSNLNNGEELVESYGFNPANLSENTKCILSSIVSNINIEKNLPNLSKHLRQQSNPALNQICVQNEDLHLSCRSSSSQSMRSSVAETVIYKNKNSQELANRSKSFDQENLSTSRNPILFDEADSSAEHALKITEEAINHSHEDSQLDLPQIRKDILSLIKVQGMSLAKQESFDSNSEEIVKFRTEFLQANNPETLSYSETLNSQREINLITQTETPEYGYKFQSRTDKEGLESGGSKEFTSYANKHPFMASFGVTQLYEIGSLQDVDYIDDNMTEYRSFSDSTLPNKANERAKQLNTVESNVYFQEETAESQRQQSDRERSSRARSRPFETLHQATVLTMGDTTENAGVEMTKSICIADTSMSNSKYEPNDCSAGQILKESYLRQERNSTGGTNLSHSRCMEERLLPIHMLKKLFESIKMYAEDLIDEIFRYLNDNFVNKNYFVQMLTNCFNHYPQFSQAIGPHDVAQKIFEICDQNRDGIISVNDLGNGSMLFCQKRPGNDCKVRSLYNLLDCEKRGFILENDVVNLLIKTQSLSNDDQSKYAEMREEMESPHAEGARVFRELDKEHRGVASYWDVFMWKDSFHFSQVIERTKKYAGQLMSRSQNVTARELWRSQLGAADYKNRRVEISDDILSKNARSADGEEFYVKVQGEEEEAQLTDLTKQKQSSDNFFQESGYLDNRITNREFSSKPALGSYQNNDTDVVRNTFFSPQKSSEDNFAETEQCTHCSPKVIRHSWQRPRYTLSTIYENSLSRLEAEDPSFWKQNYQEGGQLKNEETSTLRAEEGDKENWGMFGFTSLESEAIQATESDSKQRKRYSSSAGKVHNTIDSEVVFEGSTPKKLKILRTSQDVNCNSQTKYASKLEF